MNIDPKSLKLFISVVKHGTIAAAAEHEHIAAAAVSRRMSHLEAELGTPLLERSNKGITPTPAGEALLDLAHRVLNELDDIRFQMADYAKGMKGHMRVFANISAISQFMAGELSHFQANNPLVQIHLEEHVSSVIWQSVSAGQADIGVATLSGRVEDIELLPYHRDRLILVVPRSHPLQGRVAVRFEETLAYDYVGLPQGSQVNNQIIRVARELGKPWRSRVKVASYDALCLMVEAGLGVGLLPERTASKYAHVFDVECIHLEEPWAERQLAIGIRSYDSLSPSARQLVDQMQASAKSTNG